MFPSYFFVSVLYHYLCYYSIYKMHKNTIYFYKTNEMPLIRYFFSTNIFTLCEINSLFLTVARQIHLCDDQYNNDFNRQIIIKMI